jgi:hypothetical protein
MHASRINELAQSLLDPPPALIEDDSDDYHWLSERMIPIPVNDLDDSALTNTPGAQQQLDMKNQAKFY